MPRRPLRRVPQRHMRLSADNMAIHSLAAFGSTPARSTRSLAVRGALISRDSASAMREIRSTDWFAAENPVIRLSPHTTGGLAR